MSLYCGIIMALLVYTFKAIKNLPNNFHIKIFLIGIIIRKIIAISLWCHLQLLQFVFNYLPEFTVLLTYCKVYAKLENCTKSVWKHKTFENCFKRKIQIAKNYLSHVFSQSDLNLKDIGSVMLVLPNWTVYSHIR